MQPNLVVTGLGVVSAIGQGKADFCQALLDARHRFAVMQRPGRQMGSSFLGAEITDLRLPDSLDPRTRRSASWSAIVALTVLEEAWTEARLSEVAANRIGLVIGGSNLQQRELVQMHDQYRERPAFLRPTYGLSFLDSDLCGFCTASFGIKGLAYTIGGASASGQLALIEAAHLVRGGQVDVCIALGALMDISYWECQGLRALGAMGSDSYADAPELACRPFDRDSDGFIFGECCGAVVVESEKSCARRRVRPYAILRGLGLAMDSNRNPDPSLAGEVHAIQAALRTAGWNGSDVDYVNPHGTGSTTGDRIELQAIHACGLSEAFVNATKSLTGHGLTAAGAVEVVATLLQMDAGFLHPTRNLENPIDETLQWVRAEPIRHQIRRALTLSMGFGGINTALCWHSFADAEL